MKVLAIIRNVHCGVGDYGQPALWFDVYTTENTAALKVFNWQQAGELIEAAGVRDVEKLAGMPCWVEEGGGLIRFVEMWKK